MRPALPLLAAALAITVTAAAPALAAPAPRVAEASFAALPQPLPLPSDEKAEAHQDVVKGKARALKAHKLLLLDFGGNWCLDCRLFAGTIELPTLKPWVKKHFEVVTVDVGRYTKNLDITAAYGTPRPKGVPAIFIVDPKNDKVLNKGRETALADARSMNPQALADWLAQWVK